MIAHFVFQTTEYNLFLHNFCNTSTYIRSSRKEIWMIAALLQIHHDVEQ